MSRDTVGSPFASVGWDRGHLCALLLHLTVNISCQVWENWIRKSLSGVVEGTSCSVLPTGRIYIVYSICCSERKNCDIIHFCWNFSEVNKVTLLIVLTQIFQSWEITWPLRKNTEGNRKSEQLLLRELIPHHLKQCWPWVALWFWRMYAIGERSLKHLYLAQPETDFNYT